MIDWDRIAELRNDVLCEDFAEVFMLFLEEVEEVLGRLRASVSPTSLEEDFHFLKGSAVNVGFTGLGELCQAGERAAAMGISTARDIAAVSAAYEASLAAFMDRAHEFGLAA